jgi:hypothetical protein
VARQALDLGALEDDPAGARRHDAEIERSVVDLPAPLALMSATISPSLTLIEMLERLDRP